MKIELPVRWCVSWQYVDRRQLFDALRGNDKWRSDVLDNMQPMDDHDTETIMASVYVESLDELRDLLNATASIKTQWGAAVCVNGRDDSDSGPLSSAYASLVSKDSQFSSGDMAIYGRTAKPGENIAVDKLREAQSLIASAIERASIT